MYISHIFCSLVIITFLHVVIHLFSYCTYSQLLFNGFILHVIQSGAPYKGSKIPFLLIGISLCLTLCRDMY